MLSSEQFEQFDKKGYLLISGLLSEDIIEKAEGAMWKQMGMDPDEPSTWRHLKRPHLAGFYIENMSNENRIELFGLTHPDILACCTPNYLKILKQLSDKYPKIPNCKCDEPDGVWAMNQSLSLMNGEFLRHILMDIQGICV